MTQIDLKLIKHLSTGLLTNVKLYAEALQFGEEICREVYQREVSLDDLLSLFFLAAKDASKLKQVATSFDLGETLSINHPFHEEADRIQKETQSQKHLLNQLLGIKESWIDISPEKQKLAKLRNLALAGISVSKED